MIRIARGYERHLTTAMRDQIAAAVAAAYGCPEPSWLYETPKRGGHGGGRPASEARMVFEGELRKYAVTSKEAVAMSGRLKVETQRPSWWAECWALDTQEARDARERVAALGLPVPVPRRPRSYRFQASDDVQEVRRRFGGSSEQYAAACLWTSTAAVGVSYQRALRTVRTALARKFKGVDPQDVVAGLCKALTYRQLACTLADIADEAGVDPMEVARAFVAARKALRK